MYMCAGYAQAGYATGYAGQGYGAFAASGNNPTPCRYGLVCTCAHSACTCMLLY